MIDSYPRYNIFIVHRIIDPKVHLNLPSQYSCTAFESLIFHKNFLPGVSFFFNFFSSHTLRGLACVLFWVFILSITLVCLISPSFPIVFLWNLLQSFTYVYPTRQPIYSFRLLNVKSSQYLLHYMLEFAVTHTKIKSIAWNSIPIYYIYIFIFERSLKKMWRRTFPGEAYQSYLTYIYNLNTVSTYIKLLNPQGWRIPKVGPSGGNGHVISLCGPTITMAKRSNRQV